jgi:hypothetical protein
VVLGIGADDRARRLGYVAMTRTALPADGNPAFVSVVSADRSLVEFGACIREGSAVAPTVSADSESVVTSAPIATAVVPPPPPVGVQAPQLHRQTKPLPSPSVPLVAPHTLAGVPATVPMPAPLPGPGTLEVAASASPSSASMPPPPPIPDVGQVVGDGGGQLSRQAPPPPPPSPGSIGGGPSA